MELGIANTYHFACVVIQGLFGWKKCSFITHHWNIITHYSINHFLSLNNNEKSHSAHLTPKTQFCFQHKKLNKLGPTHFNHTYALKPLPDPINSTHPKYLTLSVHISSPFHLTFSTPSVASALSVSPCRCRSEQWPSLGWTTSLMWLGWWTKSERKIEEETCEGEGVWDWRRKCEMLWIFCCEFFHVKDLCIVISRCVECWSSKGLKWIW